MTIFNSINTNEKLFKEWIQSGIISCSVLFHWEIYARYDALKKMGNSEVMTRFRIAEQYKMNESTVFRIVKKMESDVSTNN
jgi:hypothetical protein